MSNARTIAQIINDVKEVKLPMEGASNIPVGERVTLLVTEADIVCLQNASGKRWRTTTNALAGYRIFEDATKADKLVTSDELWNTEGHMSLQEKILAGAFGETTGLTCIGSVKRVDRNHPRIGFYYKPKAYKAYDEYEKLRLDAMRAPQEVSDADRARGVRTARDLWAEAYTVLRESGLRTDATDKDIEMMPVFMLTNK